MQPTDELIALRQRSKGVAADIARPSHVREVGGPIVDDGREVVHGEDAIVERAELFGPATFSRLHQRAEVRLHRRAVRCDEPMVVTLHECDRARFAAAQFRGLAQDALQDRVAFARVFTDQPEHFGGCRLELQRLRQLGVALLDVGEQPGVRDRVAGLDGERLEQLDLLLGERVDDTLHDGDPQGWVTGGDRDKGRRSVPVRFDPVVDDVGIGGHVVIHSGLTGAEHLEIDP